MTNYRGLLWSLVAIAGTATAAAVAYRYVTRGVRPSEDEDAETRRRNGTGGNQTETEGDRRRGQEEQDAYELLSDEEDVEDAEIEDAMLGVDAIQTQEQQLMLLAREGNMLLLIVGLIMIVLVGLVGVVVSWSSDTMQSPMELPMFQPLMWLAFGVFTAATVEVLSSASTVTTAPEEIPVLSEKAVFPHDQSDFEMINRYNARKPEGRGDNQPRDSTPRSQPRDARHHDDEEEKADVPVVAGDVASIVAPVEELFKENKHRETYELLKKAVATRPNEIELLWRLARACNYLVDESSDPEQKKAFAFEGLTHADKAYEVDVNCAASNKWKGIMTGSVGNFRDLKDKIASAYVIRDLIQRAVELDPQDATCHNILGQWCLAFADMTWIEKRAAAALFGKPPTATYEEAVAHFQNAERISPGFWKKNVFLLAQTYFKMKNEDEAREWLAKAQDVAVKTKEDEDVAKEIAALAKKLKM